MTRGESNNHRSSPRKRGPTLGDVRVHSALKTRVNALMAAGSPLSRGRTERAAPCPRMSRPHSCSCRAKQRLELAPQHHVDLRHGHRNAEINKARHTIALPGHAARHDALEMRELGFHVERHAMERDPALHPDPDRGDLVLAAVFGSLALVGPAHPYADPILAPLAADVEGGKCADHP